MLTSPQDRNGGEQTTERAVIVSSDGHAAARMGDYRPYMPTKFHEEFDAFCAVYEEKGTRSFEPKNMIRRTDPEVVEDWIESAIDTERVLGLWDAERRLKEMAREGVVAEVIFPDFGLPFELYAPMLEAQYGYVRTAEQLAVGDMTYNRWLVDYCSIAPLRFVPQAIIRFQDIDTALKEIRWAHKAGLKGVVLPRFTEDRPIFDSCFDPVWNLLEELEMPVSSHIAISSVNENLHSGWISRAPHPACVYPLFSTDLYYHCHQILSHMIWGGVFERHPRLQLVMTEQGSGWVTGALQQMDYSWDGGYLRRDIREVIRQKPSEYFKRQCHLGSSLFSLAEAEARYEIGVDKIAIGVDYPHHEGTWGVGPGTQEWLRATLGAAGVPKEEARMMLGTNAAKLWGLDIVALREAAAEIGPLLDDILKPPTEEYYERGDIHKPLASPSI
jgi:predicted TIM-barrel fold metal-dependent hydrolase